MHTFSHVYWLFRHLRWWSLYRLATASLRGRIPAVGPYSRPCSLISISLGRSKQPSMLSSTSGAPWPKLLHSSGCSKNIKESQHKGKTWRREFRSWSKRTHVAQQPRWSRRLQSRHARGLDQHVGGGLRATHGKIGGRWSQVLSIVSEVWCGGTFVGRMGLGAKEHQVGTTRCARQTHHSRWALWTWRSGAG
jgi:hypothetical protein